DRPAPPRREPKAHLRKLDMDAAGIERNVDDVARLGEAEAAHFEHDAEGKNGGISELETGAGSLLMLGDGRTYRLRYHWPQRQAGAAEEHETQPSEPALRTLA